MTAAAFERILAIKLADLGDVLITEPALRSLRTAYPGARIDVLTTPASSALVPLLDPSYNRLTFPKHDFDNPRALAHPASAMRLARFSTTLRRARYDAVAILHHLTTPAGALKFRALAHATGAETVAGLDNGRGRFLTHPAIDLGFGAKHAASYMLDVARQLGGADVDPRPTLSGSASIKRTEPLTLPERYAAIFPTTGPFAPGRNWPATSFARLARFLLYADLQPVILGAADAKDAARTILDACPSAIDLTGRTTLTDVLDIVSNATVTVSGDSFPGHLSRAVGCPVVSIFGPSNQHAWAPFGAVEAGCGELSTALVVRHDMACSPCLYTGHRLGRPNGCPVRTCLNAVTAEDVMSAVQIATRGRA